MDITINMDSNRGDINTYTYITIYIHMKSLYFLALLLERTQKYSQPSKCKNFLESLESSNITKQNENKTKQNNP